MAAVPGAEGDALPARCISLLQEVKDLIDVNKKERPNTTSTVRAICTFAVYFFGLSTFFVASLLFLLFVKGISYCYIIKEKARAVRYFKRS